MADPTLTVTLAAHPGLLSSCLERYSGDRTWGEKFYTKWGYRWAEILLIKADTPIEAHEIMSFGALKVADFVAASGVYGKAPRYSKLVHMGTYNDAATVGVIVAYRLLVSNGTVADWYMACDKTDQAAANAVLSNVIA